MDSLRKFLCIGSLIFFFFLGGCQSEIPPREERYRLLHEVYIDKWLSRVGSRSANYQYHCNDMISSLRKEPIICSVRVETHFYSIAVYPNGEIVLVTVMHPLQREN